MAKPQKYATETARSNWQTVVVRFTRQFRGAVLFCNLDLCGSFTHHINIIHIHKGFVMPPWYAESRSEAEKAQQCKVKHHRILPIPKHLFPSHIPSQIPFKTSKHPPSKQGKHHLHPLHPKPSGPNTRANVPGRSRAKRLSRRCICMWVTAPERERFRARLAPKGSTVRRNIFKCCWCNTVNLRLRSDHHRNHGCCDDIAAGDASASQARLTGGLGTYERCSRITSRTTQVPLFFRDHGIVFGSVLVIDAAAAAVVDLPDVVEPVYLIVDYGVCVSSPGGLVRITKKMVLSRLRARPRGTNSTLAPSRGVVSDGWVGISCGYQ